jgi:predicted kinase
MNESTVNRWAGKSTEDVLAESYHELREPIYNAVGYLSVLKANQLSAEQAQQYIDLALKYALYTQDIVDSVYQYMNEKRKDQ